MKKILIFFIWILSIIFISGYIHENPELVEKIKKNFKDDKNLVLGSQEGEILRSPGNSFMIEFSKVFFNLYIQYFLEKSGYFSNFF